MNEKMKKNIQILIAIGISIVLIVIDQITKKLAVAHLIYQEEIPFIKGILNFKLEYNDGFAFGMGSGYQIIWAFVSLIGCAVLLYFMKYIDFKNNWLFTIAIVLMFSGTFGNMIDRMFSAKGVIDFFNPAFIEFAVFNVADSYLTIGTILLIVYILFIYKEPEIKKKEEVEKVEEQPND